MIGAPVTCPVLVGRGEELAALTAARSALSKSRGSAILIGGEAGIGKSRLLGHFLRQSGDGRARTIAAGECLERAQQPFGPIRSLIADLYAGLDVRTVPANALRAVAQLADGLVDVPERLRSLAPLEKSDLFPALVAFFKFVCERRATVLAIEDLHWADRSSLEFLEYFVTRLDGSRLLLVATYRSDEVDGNAALMAALARMTRESAGRTIELRLLSAPEVRQLLDGACEHRAPLPPRTLEDIAKRSEGNPFFAEELLKGALDERSTANRPDLPRSIRTSILARLAELDPDDRRVLAYAAALGYRFDPALLAVVLGRELDRVLATLHRARNLNIIVDERGSEAGCRFRHALTRQTIYDDLLATDARRLHAQILATLETLPDADAHVEALAYNAAAARDAAKTLAYAERAGDVALGVNACFEAGEHFARALALAPDAARRGVLLEKLADAQWRLGLGERAFDNFEAARALALERDEIDRAATLLARSHATMIYAGNIEGSISLVERFLEVWGDRISPARMVDLRCVLAMAAANFGDAPRMRAYLASVAEADIAGDVRLRLRFGICEAIMAAIEGDRASWRRAAVRVEGVLSADLADFAGFASRMALSAISVAENERAETWLAEVIALCRERGNLGNAGYALSLRAFNWLLLGRLADAHAAILEAARNDTAFATKYHVVAVGPPIGLALGDQALVRASLDPAMIDAFRTNRQLGPFVVTGSGLAIALIALERASEARRLLSEIVDALRVPYFSMYALPTAAAHVDAAHLATLRAFCAAHARPERPVFNASTAHVEAIAAARAGDAARAATYGRSAARAYAELGWTLFEAHAYEIAGDVDAARGRYERCGAVADARRLTARAAGAEPGRRELSLREREVAHHVSQGLTNAAIAERLSVSQKTIEKHISSIFAKWEIGSRAELAAAVARGPGVSTEHVEDDATGRRAAR